MVRVVVTGGRDFTDREYVYMVLDELHRVQPITVLIEGEARGVDTFSRQWAEDNNIVIEKYPAQWKKYGNAAGPIRNKQMLTEGKPNIAVVFQVAPVRWGCGVSVAMG